MTSIASTLVGRIQIWNASHPDQQIDPQAALAVARQEGLSGAVGDGGHAFGDFQLNDAGGVITGMFPDWTAEQKQAWANSPDGIDFALGKIAGVAGGLHGSQAVGSIVSRFERPANIPREIANANSALGIYGAVKPTAPASTPFAAPVVRPVVQAAPQASNGMSQSTQAILEALLASHPAMQTPATPHLALPALPTPTQNSLPPASFAAPPPLTLG